MSWAAVAVLRRGIRLRRFWALVAIIGILLGALGWRLGIRRDVGWIEYRMPVRTDIPTAIAIAPDGAIWFTIEFSDAIGVLRDGKLQRLQKGTANLEPLGLAIDQAGIVWFTDVPMRAISRMEPEGNVRSFPLATPIVRLGRLAVGPGGAVWFADITTASLMRLQEDVFTRVSFDSGIPYGVAVDAGGVVWTALQGADKLARISPDGKIATFEVPTRNCGLGDIAVDAGGAAYFIELRSNKIGRFAEGRFTEFEIPSPSAGAVALATARDGSVWFTELSAGKLGRLRNGKISEYRLPRADARPFGVAVDHSNNVWYTDISGWLGMLPAP